MAKAKKKTLPKDFEKLLEAGDLRKLQAVFEGCDVGARGGYGKQTALAFERCPDELARWLVERGADVNARDERGRTPLHVRARSRRGGIDVLLELGADVHAAGASTGTPLHVAADGKHAANAAKLLARGAKVDARNEEGLTPLELALRGCSNIEIEGMVELARVLLGAGARRTPAMNAHVTEIGERFEFHRDGFAKDSVDATSAALYALYALFEVTPVARRRVHDAKSPIAVTATRWQQQHTELWNLLVPSSGAAATVQGEVIRISGRISHELLDNGGVNWDDDFKAMSRAFLAHVQTGTPLAPAELTDIRAIVDGLVRKGDGDTRRLTELAVTWVLRNPTPLPLAAPPYRR